MAFLTHVRSRWQLHTESPKELFKVSCGGCKNVGSTTKIMMMTILDWHLSRFFCGKLKWLWTVRLDDELLPLMFFIWNFDRKIVFGSAQDSENGRVGKKVPHVFRQLGGSEQTYYRWRKEYGGQ